MTFKDLFDAYKQTTEDRVLLLYRGEMDQDTLIDLGSTLKSRLGGDKKSKNIFAVFVELAHNLLHHSAERIQNEAGENIGTGIIIVRERDDYFSIESGNLVNKEAVASLEASCHEVMTLDKERLRALFLERRKNSSLRSTGAGLGLIVVARKADYPPHFAFHSFDDRYSFFTVSVRFRKGE